MPALKKSPKDRVLIGVIHLPALPGAPESRHPIAKITDHAVTEAEMLLGESFDGLIVENYGDAPFYPADVPPITTASMARIVHAIRKLGDFLLGVNVLRNDATAALSIAEACGADFIRINIHTGAFTTDQGIIEGRAHETMRLRKHLNSSVEIWTDLLCKHASPLAPVSLEDAAHDLVTRGQADRLIITGSRTGIPASAEDLDDLLEMGLDRDIYVGSGVKAENLGQFTKAAGVIIGSAIRRGGVAGAPLDIKRIRQFVSAWKSIDKG